MTGHVFISHSDKDKTFAELMLNALESRGIRCWVAPRDIPPGGSYADAIMGAIEECNCFVLIYTAHSNTSGHVLREVERALKFGKNIIPTRFDQSEPSRGLDYLLATVHWLSVDTATAKNAVARAAEQIAACVPHLATVPVLSTPVIDQRPRPTIAEGSRPGGRNFVLIGILLILLISAATLLVSQFLARKEPSKNVGENIPSPTVQPQPAQPQSVLQSTPAQQTSPAYPLAAPSPTPALVQQPSSFQSPVREAAASPSSHPIEQSSEPTSGNEPQDVLRQYFASFRERDPAAAYSFLSGKFKAKLSFKKFSETFASTREIQLIDAKKMSSAKDAVKMFVAFREVDAEFQQSQWRGPIDLVKDPDGWRIETMKELRRASLAEISPAPETKLPPATGQPTRAPEHTWDRPHIYLQLANESQRGAAMELKRRLKSSGYVVAAVETVSGNVDIPQASSELRYFAQADSAEAQRIAKELDPFFKRTGIVAYVPEGMPYVSHARQYEIWFSQSFQ